MNNNKIITLCFLATCIFIFITQNAMAGADWQEKQKKMFAQIPVKPGDVVDKSNWEKVRNILPEPIVNWVKKGDWTIKVGELEYDFDYNPKWYDLSSKNKGKYILGSKKEVIDRNTGKYPLFVRGIPFPDVDVKNDPDGATKLMHNNNICLMMNNSFYTWGEPKEGLLQWIGRDGHERGIGMSMRRLYYWNRSDGGVPNPNDFMHTTSTITTWPFDLSGTCTLYIRHLDGRDDTLYAYVPAIRRIKRLSGANRSDPQMGSDQCMDDGDGWSGQVEAMKWTYVDDKIMLVPKFELDAKTPQVLENKKGIWDYNNIEGIKMGYEKPGWTGVPWAFTNALWVPREVWIVEAKSLDPYYAYGSLVLHLDKLAMINVYSMKYTRAGQYWKMLVNLVPQCVIPNPDFSPTDKVFNMNGPMVVVDEQTQHASTIPQDDNHKIPDSPLIVPRNFTPQAMRTWTK